MLGKALVAVLLTTTACALPKGIPRERIDELVAPEVRSYGGIAVGIIVGNQQRVFGYGSNTPNGSTLFEVGSISKVFTGTLLDSMIEEGLVDLNDPIRKFLPRDVVVEKEITLRHLVTHTSGLPRIPTNLWKRIKNRANPWAHYRDKDLYEFLSKYKFKREPGEKHEYSNVGMGLLGHLLALRAGRSYEDLLRKRICAPLGMKDTVITLSPEQEERFEQGHSRKGKPVSAWDLPALEGAGAIRSTVNNMLTFLAACLDGRYDRCHIPLFTVDKGQMDLAMAWHIQRFIGMDHKAIWHNGETGGFHSFLAFVRETKTAVVVLSSTSNDIDEMAVRLLILLQPKEKV